MKPIFSPQTREIAELRSTAGELESAMRGGGEAAAGGGDLESLRAQLQYSEQKRKQVERDFEELVASMERGDSVGGEVLKTRFSHWDFGRFLR